MPFAPLATQNSSIRPRVRFRPNFRSKLTRNFNKLIDQTTLSVRNERLFGLACVV